MSELTLQAARRIDPRKVGLALAVIWVVFAIVGIIVDRGGSWTLQAFNPADSDLDDRLSMPASFTALLMLLAAGMAFALSRVDRTRREKIWRLAGWALVVIGVEQLLGVHSWLVVSRDVPWTIAYLPLLLVGTLVLVRAMPVLKSQPAVQAMFGAAIVLWAGAGALDNPDFVTSNAATEILEMAAGSLFALSLLARLRYLAAQYYPLEEAHTRLSVDQIAAEALDHVKFRPILTGILLVTAAFAIQHVLLQTNDYHEHRVPILDVNTEQTLWATLQGTLIFAVALLSILISRLRATPVHVRPWWLLLGAILIVLGADEIVAIHDRFQDATDYPGQIVLIPVACVGIAAWWKVLGAVTGNRQVRNLLIAGAALWLLSQMIDVLIQDDFRWTIVPEEVMETLGSTCWLFALGHWLRAVLPVGVFPLKPVQGMLHGRATIAPLPESGKAAQAPTG
jgi:hypothetical protein